MNHCCYRCKITGQYLAHIPLRDDSWVKLCLVCADEYFKIARKQEHMDRYSHIENLRDNEYNDIPELIYKRITLLGELKEISAQISKRHKDIEQDLHYQDLYKEWLEPLKKEEDEYIHGSY